MPPRVEMWIVTRRYRLTVLTSLLRGPVIYTVSAAGSILKTEPVPNVHPLD